MVLLRRMTCLTSTRLSPTATLTSPASPPLEVAQNCSTRRAAGAAAARCVACFLSFLFLPSDLSLTPRQGHSGQSASQEAVGGDARGQSPSLSFLLLVLTFSSSSPLPPYLRLRLSSHRSPTKVTRRVHNSPSSASPSASTSLRLSPSLKLLSKAVAPLMPPQARRGVPSASLMGAL